MFSSLRNDVALTAQPRASNAAALLALAAAGITTAGASLTALGHLKDAAISAGLHGSPLGVGVLLGALRGLDLLFVVLAAAAVLGLAWLEWRRRSVTRLLHTASPLQAFGLLTLVLLWTGHSYLFPGLQLGGDTSSHVVRFNEVARGLESGVLPDWTNYGYIGEPLLWFTGPLTYVVGGVLAFLLHDANLALKWLLFLTHVLAGWAMWALLRRWGVGAVAAAFAAGCFGGSFATLHLFFYRGETPQALTILLLVLLFYAADGLMRGIGRRWAGFLVFALSTAGLIVNHQPHAIFAALYLLVFGAVAVATGFWRLRGMPLVALAGALGVLASLVAVAPLLLESDWVMIEPEGAGIGVRAPGVDRLLLLLRWHDTLTMRGNEYWAYLGFGLVVLALFGAVGLLVGRARGGPGWPALACVAASLVLHNPVVRDVIFILFFGSVLAAVGLDWLIALPVLAGRRLLLLGGLILADLASTAIQPVARVDKGFQIEAGRVLERDAPGERVMQVGFDRTGSLVADMGPDGSILSYASLVQRVAGNHNMAATRVHNFIAVAIKRAEAELRTAGTLSAETRLALGLFNVSRILCNTPIANGCPASVQGTVAAPVLGPVVPVTATPAVFSPALTVLDLAAGVDKPMIWENHFDEPEHAGHIEAVWRAMTAFLDAEAIDFGTRTARTIAVRGPGPLAAAGPASGAPLTIKNYQVRLESVTLTLDAPGAGYVQLSHPWIPSAVVTVNGARVRPLRGTIGLAVVPVSAGESVIIMREGGTAVRLTSMLASVAGLMAIFGATLLLALRPVRPVSAGADPAA